MVTPMPPGPRSAARLGLPAVALLLAGWLMAPRLPPAWLLPISAGWLLIAAGVAAGLLRRLHRRVPWVGPGLVALAGGAAMGVVGHDWRGARAVDLPCRRDWAWLPSYLLRSSPTESIEFTVGEARVKVCYGSPASRGRKMLGGPRIPYGHLWRTGANEPTTIAADRPITVAGLPVVDGKVSLYTVPGPETWEIILNRSTTQWGIESEYDQAVEAREVGRTLVPSATGEPTERLRFHVEPGSDPGEALLVLSWESTVVRLPVRAVR